MCQHHHLPASLSSSERRDGTGLHKNAQLLELDNRKSLTFYLGTSQKYEFCEAKLRNLRNTQVIKGTGARDKKWPKKVMVG